MNAKPFLNGQRKLSVIVSMIIGVLIVLGSTFMAAKALIEDYALYRIHTDANTQRFVALEATVKNLEDSKQLDEVKKILAVVQTQASNTYAHVLSIESYQTTIRKELKEVAETKLNSSDYWRQDKELNSRIEYLERSIK